jgi:hypothetical protein
VPVPQDVAVSHEAGADAGSQGDPDGTAVPARRAGPPFAEHERVGIMVEADADGTGQKWCQGGAEIEVE